MITPTLNVAALIDHRSIPEPMSGCWLWMMALGSDGYGRISIRGRTRLAHRASWEAHRGAIPVAMVIDHLCRNRSCVNPDHLRVTTIGENVRCGNGPTGQHLRATHCIRGHAFDAINTYRYARTGWRRCRECQRTRHKEPTR